MKKSRTHLRITGIFLGLLTILVFVLESGYLQGLRSWVVSLSVFSFLAGRREFLSNIVLGLWTGAIATIIAYIVEHCFERKQFLADMIAFFRSDIFSVTEELGQESDEEIHALSGAGIIDKLNAFVEEYKKSFKIYDKRYSKEYPDEKSPLAWRVAYFLSLLGNYYTLRLGFYTIISALEACVAIDEKNPVDLNSEASIATSTEQFWLDFGLNEREARKRAKSMRGLDDFSLALTWSLYESQVKTRQDLEKRKSQQEELLNKRNFFLNLLWYRNGVWDELCQNPKSKLESILRRHQ